MPTEYKILDKIYVEHINTSNDSPMAIVGSDTIGTSVAGSNSLNTGEPGDSELIEQSTRISGRNLDVLLVGQGQVKIRSITQDIIAEKSTSRD